MLARPSQCSQWRRPGRKGCGPGGREERSGAAGLLYCLIKVLGPLLPSGKPPVCSLRALGAGEPRTDVRGPEGAGPNPASPPRPSGKEGAHCPPPGRKRGRPPGGSGPSPPRTPGAHRAGPIAGAPKVAGFPAAQGPIPPIYPRRPPAAPMLLFFLAITPPLHLLLLLPPGVHADSKKAAAGAGYQFWSSTPGSAPATPEKCALQNWGLQRSTPRTIFGHSLGRKHPVFLWVPASSSDASDPPPPVPEVPTQVFA